MKLIIPRLWLGTMVTLLALQGPLPGLMATGHASEMPAPAGDSALLAAGDTIGVEVGPSGGPWTCRTVGV